MELDEAALARRSQDAVEAVEHGIVAMAGKLRRRVSTARRSEWIRPPYLFRVFKPGARRRPPIRRPWRHRRARGPNRLSSAADTAIDRASRSPRRLEPLRIDLSAIAKGFDLDAPVNVMKEFGVHSFLDDIDGKCAQRARSLTDGRGP